MEDTSTSITLLGQQPKIKRTSNESHPDHGPARGYDPVTTLVEIARDPTTPTVLRLQAASNLLPYAHVKLQEFDVRVDSETTRDQADEQALNEALMRSPSSVKIIEAAVIERQQMRRRLLAARTIEAAPQL
jgi:hypothetical protein